MSAYATTATFYDAIAFAQTNAVDEAIVDVLTGLQEGPRSAVDIGAGTGLSTALIAKALPEATIFAVEPDAAMRAALMTRVCSQPTLRRRVSILPMPLSEAPLPDIVSTFVARASLVHFSPWERQGLWSLISRHLSPEGCAVFEIQCPEAVSFPETLIASARVGEVSYESRASAERIDEKRQCWRMTYSAQLSGEEIDRQTCEHICWAASPDELLTEAAAQGLAGYEQGPLVVVHH